MLTLEKVKYCQKLCYRETHMIFDMVTAHERSDHAYYVILNNNVMQINKINKKISIKRWRYFRMLLTFCFCYCLPSNTGRQRSSASASRTRSEELTSYKYQLHTGQSIFWSRLWRSSTHDEMIYFWYLMHFSIGQRPQLDIIVPTSSKIFKKKNLTFYI